jgi:hypothetical protein
MRRETLIAAGHSLRPTSGTPHAEATTARRQALRRVGRPYKAQWPYKRYRQQQEITWSEVLAILGIGLLAIPLSMALEIYS